ncbi:hypothetical protein LBMAG42_03110 [Deltaproteobacteria bacterium]|nr:hypothetical protein LBMAG42_03110 [Deltaproteobacteria bacterium]
MPRDPTALVLADEPGPRALRVADALGASIATLGEARRAGRGATLVFAFAGLADLPMLALRLASLHPRALIVTPLGAPGSLSRWNAPIARFCFPSQAAARRWLPHIPLGRLVVVEPGLPALAPPDGVFVASAADALDLEAIVAAAAAGAAIVSPIAHAALPPGAVVSDDVVAARAALIADPSRLRALGHLSREWAARGRSPADESAAILALAAEVRSMSARGGRAR